MTIIVPCFYQVIETWVKVWENKKCCGNTSRPVSVSTAFLCSPKLPFLFLGRNTENMFSIFFRKIHKEKRKNNLFSLTIKMKLPLLMPSLRQQLVLVLRFYRILHQSVCIFSLGYFLNIIYINIIKSTSHDHVRICFWLIKEHSMRWLFQTHYMYLYHMHFLKCMYMYQYRV